MLANAITMPREGWSRPGGGRGEKWTIRWGVGRYTVISYILQVLSLGRKEINELQRLQPRTTWLLTTVLGAGGY